MGPPCAAPTSHPLRHRPPKPTPSPHARSRVGGPDPGRHDLRGPRTSDSAYVTPTRLPRDRQHPTFEPTGSPVVGPGVIRVETDPRGVDTGCRRDRRWMTYGHDESRRFLQTSMKVYRRPTPHFNEATPGHDRLPRSSKGRPGSDRRDGGPLETKVRHPVRTKPPTVRQEGVGTVPGTSVHDCTRTTLDPQSRGPKDEVRRHHGIPGVQTPSPPDLPFRTVRPGTSPGTRS